MAEEEGEASNSANNKLLIEALTANMEKLMDAKLEAFKQELVSSSERSSSKSKRRGQTHHTNQTRPHIEDFGLRQDAFAAEYYSTTRDSSENSQRSGRRPRENRQHTHDQLQGIKLRIPSFSGQSDPDIYLDWEKKMELVFDCQTHSEANKVRVAATEFSDYALTWWDQIVTSRRRNREEPINTWERMKALMRRRFVPSYYQRELHQKLRRLSQGSKSVEEYYQEMETMLIRADVREDREATMARFLGGLSRDVQDRMEMEHYEDLEQMLHKAVLIEQQLKRKGSIRVGYGGSGSTRASYQREDKSTHPRDYKAPAAAKEWDRSKVAAPQPKANSATAPARTRDVKCFKCQGMGHYANACPNKRIVVIRTNGDVESEDESLEATQSEGEVELPVVGNLMVARRALSVQPKPEEEEQRQNLFHTRCLVQGKVCSLIIDGGSCTNVASEVMVKKLGMTTTKHPHPYKLQWLNESGELGVTEQVLVPLSIGKYEDEILCDILPMEASHILLGRPWQSD